MTPFWPLGLADFADSWVSMGLTNGRKAYLAVWKREEGSSEIELPINMDVLPCENLQVMCIYPDKADIDYQYDDRKRLLRVRTEKKVAARVFEICDRKGMKL